MYCSNQKIYQLLCTHKDKTDINLKPGEYRIPCTCGKVYIGETGRNLKVRKNIKIVASNANPINLLWQNMHGKMTIRLNGMILNFWCQ